MNFKKFINSDYLKSNPLCGIDTYKDELNLSTGACTRKIKKLVLTGSEISWAKASSGSVFYNNSIVDDADNSASKITLLCSHYVAQENISGVSDVNDLKCCFRTTAKTLYIADSNFSTNTDFVTYLQQQYANGTPVTVYYVLATPTTETITVPSGLSGTEEGYLNQSGTPTPTNPIYPTANTAEKWFDLNYYIMGTDTDTITTLPADIYANAATATVGLKGQTIQSGTPTPQNPVMPNGCGERTGNWFDSTIYELVPVSATAQRKGTNLGVLPQGTYTLDAVTSSPTQIYRTIKNGNTYTYETIETLPYTFTTDGVSEQIIRTAGQLGDSWAEVGYTNIMLNSGSTALPYEPYGVKIPISSAGQTTPVYLGEVQTTRKIKKLVLDGTENWYIEGSDIFYTDRITEAVRYTPICSHFIGVNALTGNNQVTISQTLRINIKATTITHTASDFKTYLQQQYAAGTPVTVWYVLATPTTGIVNEPLMKIGDYADEVSNVSIPVTAGGDTISVGTTVQPSEVTANYKGWHPVADVHERDNGAWT